MVKEPRVTKEFDSITSNTRVYLSFDSAGHYEDWLDDIRRNATERAVAKLAGADAIGRAVLELFDQIEKART